MHQGRGCVDNGVLTCCSWYTFARTHANTRAQALWSLMQLGQFLTGVIAGLKIGSLEQDFWFYAGLMAVFTAVFVSITVTYEVRANVVWLPACFFAWVGCAWEKENKKKATKRHGGVCCAACFTCLLCRVPHPPAPPVCPALQYNDRTGLAGSVEHGAHVHHALPGDDDEAAKEGRESAHRSGNGSKRTMGQDTSLTKRKGSAQRPGKTTTSSERDALLLAASSPVVVEE